MVCTVSGRQPAGLFSRDRHVVYREVITTEEKSVLVVEDEGFIALQIKELLEKGGFCIAGVTAYGEDAVVLADKFRPDLVCMDIELMGRIDGIEAARRIREHNDIPIIFLTAHTDRERLTRAREAAPYSYLVKPFNDRELLATVEMAIFRHGMDRQIRESAGRIRAIVENAKEGIVVYRAGDHRILEANPALLHLLGYSSEEIGQMTIGQFLTGTGSDEILAAECVAGQKDQLREVQLRCRDGSLRIAEIAVSRIDDGCDPDLWCLIAHDVTDRKRAETAVLVANRKLNLLSSITRHDIKNQLLTLIGFIELSKRKIQDPEILHFIDRQEQVAAAITRQIDFTKLYENIGAHAPQWQRVATILEGQRPSLSAGGIEVSIAVGSLEIFADPMLEKVFANLADNSCRHGDHVSRIVFSLTPSEGEAVVIACEDNGVGVPAEEKERIFEKGFGKHTGLGLFLSREILSLTGMTIRESGTFGTGARFEITVPAGSFRHSAVVPDMA